METLDSQTFYKETNLVLTVYNLNVYNIKNTCLEYLLSETNIQTKANSIEYLMKHLN